MSPVLLAATGQPIASFGELPSGELLAVTFANAIFRLEPRPVAGPDRPPPAGGQVKLCP